jgi:hypothetical protein
LVSTNNRRNKTNSHLNGTLNGKWRDVIVYDEGTGDLSLDSGFQSPISFVLMHLLQENRQPIYLNAPIPFGGPEKTTSARYRPDHPASQQLVYQCETEDCTAVDWSVKSGRSKCVPSSWCSRWGIQSGRVDGLHDGRPANGPQTPGRLRFPQWGVPLPAPVLWPSPLSSPGFVHDVVS